MERADVPSVEGEVVFLTIWFKRLMGSPRLIVWLGLFVFLYALLASLILQLWVIPAFFTQPGAAEGLVVLDSLEFDRIAKRKAAEIVSLGWSAWELKPKGQFPAGMASVFYALFGPAPTRMLPFNAAVHAISACAVMLILRNFFMAVPALIGALVFALNPASFEWVSQIHRDGIFILGNLLLILGVLRFIRGVEPPNGDEVWYWLIWFLIPLVGTLLIWMARPYWIQIALITLIFTVVIVILTISFQGKIAGRNIILFAAMALLLGVFQLGLIHIFTSQADGFGAESQADGFGAIWQRSNWLPKAIDDRFYNVARARLGAISQGGNSLVDADWRLDSVGAIVGYVPRALQLGLFSPFSNLWAGEGSTPAMTMARKVMGGVTLFFYVCLIGCGVGLWHMRRNLLFWVMLGTCLIGILVYAIVYPNVGTLMRYRYAFHMLLISFGVAFWSDLWLKRINRSKTGEYLR